MFCSFFVIARWRRLATRVEKLVGVEQSGNNQPFPLFSHCQHCTRQENVCPMGGSCIVLKVKKENILLISCNQVSCDYDDWDDGKQLFSKMISVVDFCDDHNHPDKRETGYSNVLGWNVGEYLVISSLRWFGSLEQNFMANQNLTHGYPETKLSNHDFYKQVSRGKTI